MEKIRLQKYFTECGIMSRRAAEAEIEAGEAELAQGRKQLEYAHIELEDYDYQVYEHPSQ